MTEPSPFRAIGFTAEAENWPLSDAGAAIIAEHNGVPLDKLPPLMRHASCGGMHRWLEALGAHKAAGRQVRDPDGRWWTPARLAAYGDATPPIP